MPRLMRGLRRAQASAERDALRERRLDEVIGLVDRFMYDMARLIAGHPPEWETYVALGVTSCFTTAVAPFLAGGDAMRPDFGQFGQLRVDGDLTDSATPVEAWLEFDDRSLRETPDGRLIGSPRRRMQIWMAIALDSGRIERCQIRPCAAA